MKKTRENKGDKKRTGFKERNGKDVLFATERHKELARRGVCGTNGKGKRCKCKCEEVNAVETNPEREIARLR